MITRDQLAAALDKWADQDHHPAGKFIDDTGCVCPIGMIARECFGITDSELEDGVALDHEHGRMTVMDQVRRQVGFDLCTYIEEVNDGYLSIGSSPQKVAKSIMYEYDEQATIHYILDVYGNTSAT